jgi:hypothetical protein
MAIFVEKGSRGQGVEDSSGGQVEEEAESAEKGAGK